MIVSVVLCWGKVPHAGHPHCALGHGKWTWYEHKKPEINMLVSILQNRKLRLNKVKATQSQEEPVRKHSQAKSVLSLTRPASPQGSMFP